MTNTYKNKPASLPAVIGALVFFALIGFGAWVVGKYWLEDPAYPKYLISFGGLFLAIGACCAAVVAARNVTGKLKDRLNLAAVSLTTVGALFVGASGFLGV